MNPVNEILYSKQRKILQLEEGKKEKSKAMHVYVHTKLNQSQTSETKLILIDFNVILMK